MSAIEECRKKSKNCSWIWKDTREYVRNILQKQLDYGSQNITLGGDLDNNDDKNFALVGLWMRMNDKMQRIKNIILSQKKTQNEPLSDSWLDLSVYAIICRIVDKKYGVNN